MSKYYKPEIIPEDDGLIKPQLLEQVKDISIFSWLEEELSRSQFNQLRTTQLVIGMIENQHSDDPEEKKSRPFIYLYRADDDCVVAFQITTSINSPAFKYPLKDWDRYGLMKPCFVNVDHLIELHRNEIANIRAQSLSEEDTQGLIDWMRELVNTSKRSFSYNIRYIADYIEMQRR